MQDPHPVRNEEGMRPRIHASLHALDALDLQVDRLRPRAQ
jgi:hypothetical protein